MQTAFSSEYVVQDDAQVDLIWMQRFGKAFHSEVSSVVLVARLLSLYTQYLTSDRWRRQHQPAASEAVANLEKGTIRTLAQVSDRCSVLQTEGLILLQAQCIVDAKK